MVTFAGPYRNPAHLMTVIKNPNGEGFVLGVEIDPKEIIGAVARGEPGAIEAAQEYEKSGGYRLHTNKTVWKDEDEAHEYLESLEEHFEEAYDSYLEENSYEICQMERYEQWRNEY